MAIVATIFFAPIVLFATMANESADGFMAWLPTLAAIALCALLLFLIYRKKRVFVPDPPAPIVLSEDELKAKAEAKAKWERIEKQWWYRYPIAGLMFLGAWFLVETRPSLWWVAAIIVIYGLMLAKELGLLALIGLGCIAGYWILQSVFEGIATLPVSVAVIIGAVIIASAVSR